MSFSLPLVAELTPAQREFYDLFPANLSRGLVLTKSSARPYLSLGLSFRDCWLPPDVRELVILQVGAVTGAEYEVFHHRPLARQAGLPEETIERVVSGARTLGDKSLDALVKFVDQVIDSARNEAPSTEAIGEYYSDQEVAEIVLLVGHYLMTALFIKTLGIQPEDTAHLQAGVAHALLHAPKGGSHGT